MYVLKSLTQIGYDRSECLVNFINQEKKCVEMFELTMRSEFQTNYAKYITRDNPQFGLLSYFNLYDDTYDLYGIFYDPESVYVYGKYIFNSVLYTKAGGLVLLDDIISMFKSIDVLANKLGITNIAVPLFNSYNSGLPPAKLKDELINIFSQSSNIVYHLYE